MYMPSFVLRCKYVAEQRERMERLMGEKEKGCYGTFWVGCPDGYLQSVIGNRLSPSFQHAKHSKQPYHQQAGQPSPWIGARMLQACVLGRFKMVNSVGILFQGELR